MPAASPSVSGPGASGPAGPQPAGPRADGTSRPPVVTPHLGGGRSRRLFRPIEPVDEPLAARLGSPFRPCFRLAIYGLLVLLLMPVQAAAVGLGARRLAEAVPRFFHRTCLRVLGMRLIEIGRMSTARPTLFVCNHSSYLDITVLGALIPGCFVAKAEVAGWPLFGLLAKLQRTVFVDRQRNSTHQQRDSIAGRLAAGDNLILFPEGTSNDGNRTLPFRSALLSVAEPGNGRRSRSRRDRLGEDRLGEDRLGEAPARPLTVQPVSIAYTLLNGMPIGHGLRPLVAWYGDMALADHLWQFLRLGKLTVEIRFHEPVTIDRFGSRKALTDHCYSKVSEGVAASLTGRQPGLRPERPPAVAGDPPALPGGAADAPAGAPADAAAGG